MTPKVFKKFFPCKKKKKKLFVKPKQISSHTSYLTPPKSVKHIKKLNLGWPQKLTRNHMYRVLQRFACGVCN